MGLPFCMRLPMTDLSAPSQPVDIRASYMAQVQRRRLYSGLTMLVFVLLFLLCLLLLLPLLSYVMSPMASLVLQLFND